MLGGPQMFGAPMAMQMPGAQLAQHAPQSFAPPVMMPGRPQVMPMQQPMHATPMGASFAPPPMAMPMQQQGFPTYGALQQQPASFLPPTMPGVQVGAPQPAPGVHISAPQQVGAPQHVASVASVQPGERVRLKGISQTSPYYGKTFIVEVPNVGNGQARVKLEGTLTDLVMSPAFLELANAPMAEPASNIPQVAGHNPEWLSSNVQLQFAKADAMGNELNVGEHVQLRGKSQYSGCAMTVEAVDCGDGRVRVALQKPDGTTSRMAFDAQHLERVGGVTVVQQAGAPQTVVAHEIVQSQEQFVQQQQPVQYVQEQFVQQQQPVQFVQEQFVQQEQPVQYVQQAAALAEMQYVQQLETAPQMMPAAGHAVQYVA